jgi:hypothetical protein
MLNTQPHFHRAGQQPLRAYEPGDAFYERLIDCHRGLSDADSRLVNARLILLLANHIGDLAVLDEALAAARHGIGNPTQGANPPETTT